MNISKISQARIDVLQTIESLSVRQALIQQCVDAIDIEDTPWLVQRSLRLINEHLKNQILDASVMLGSIVAEMQS